MFANKLSVQKSALDAASGKLKDVKKTANQEGGDAAADAAAQEFESVFLSEMLSHMFSGVKPDSLFGGGHGEEMWRSFLVQEYAKITARSGGIGVADHVKREIIKLQEENQK